MLGLQLLPAAAGGHATPAKEQHWLLSVLAGILMCKIIYDLTGVVSSLLFDGYAKLQNKEKLEWKNRGFSTFHSLVVTVVAQYLLTVSDLFDQNSKEELVINRSSSLSDALLGISIGYFLADLSVIFYHYPTLGGMEYVFHHGLSMLAIIQSLLSGQAQIYILMVLLSESTTPFVNLRWYLDVAGQKESKAYVINGLALFLGWLVARILLFIYFFYHMYKHFDQVKEVYALGYYSLLTVPPALAFMNVLWFRKITMGFLKALAGNGHKKLTTSFQQ